MADEFERVLVDGTTEAVVTGQTHHHHHARIDAVRLLRAAENYAAEMRRIGQGQSARDMENNVRKARELVESAPDDGSSMVDLRSLLLFEKSRGIHSPHGHIKDPSGAVGYLWIRRSLSYQHRMFDLVLNHHRQHPHHAMPPREAALRAYQFELQPYHGWALQRIYLAAVASMTPATTQELLALVGGYMPPSSSKGRDEKGFRSSRAIGSSARRQGRRRQHSGTERGGPKMARASVPTYVSVVGGGGGESIAELPSPPLEAEMACRRDLQRLLDAWRPLIQQWRHVYADLDLEDPRRH
jgi:hypothetical protein